MIKTAILIFLIMLTALSCSTDFSKKGAGGISADGQNSEYILLNSNKIMVRINRLSMAVDFLGLNGEWLSISEPISDVHSFEIREEKEKTVFEITDQKIEISFIVDDDVLKVDITKECEGEFIWPVFSVKEPAKALIWPENGGLWIPIDDERWTEYLIGETFTLLSLPFWGIDYGNQTLTYLVINEYNNSVSFFTDESLEGSFTHSFKEISRNNSYGFLIQPGSDYSPVEPAHIYRKYLEDNNEFVSFKEKIKKSPQAERLLGSPQVYIWGDGNTTSMMDQLEETGIERIRVTTDGPMSREVSEYASKKGFLAGIYDSYHSIHSPELAGTDESWETAQFDNYLYETGIIKREDGSSYKGFQNKGGTLSSVAAYPYAEKRIAENMKNGNYNFYFLDCEAAGEIFDDYSPERMASMSDEIEARLARMDLVINDYNAVLGSEGGDFYAASRIHVAEGVFGPAFYWEDRDLKNKNSEFYIGSWWPPENPQIFFKQVELKKWLVRKYFNPAFRIPLYNTVFHDSLVTTHHWNSSSLKFLNVKDIVAMKEILYMQPPLYHLNQKYLSNQKEEIVHHYKTFSPLHREFGDTKMVSFEWLSEDRLVQKITYEGDLIIIANFSENEFETGSIKIEPMSVYINNKGVVTNYLPYK